tara:strand:- start:543 stop:701 length:159 start_codon:yes stop_codon:yes gene_type:complete
MNRKDTLLINSIFEKLKKHRDKGIIISKRDVEDLFNILNQEELLSIRNSQEQ